MTCKITGFNSACIIQEDEKVNQVVGDRMYMAPEMMKKQDYDQKVDIWAIGIIASILMTGKAPF